VTDTAGLAGRRVLVTGADGFIGSHLAEALVRAGARVRAMVQYNAMDARGWLDDVPAPVRDELEVFPADLRDGPRVREAVRGRELVFHLAALVGIPYSYHAPASYVQVNVQGTLNLLDAARDLDVARLVHTSTSEVYGTAQSVPITEDHPLRAQSPYAASKIAADQLALAFQRSFGTPVAVLRPFNTYGPRQSARAVIPTVMVQLASGARRLRLGALAPTRDFNYVADTVQGFLHVAQAEQAVGTVLNLGTGHEISIGETARLIAELMGVSVDIDQDPERVRPRASEVERLCADAARLRELTGWAPAYAGAAGLRQGLEETVRWFRDPAHLRLYRADRYTV